MNEALRDELLAMEAEDRVLRAELAADGSLFGRGYHPRMEAVHRRNAARLKAIIDQHGWPGRSLVGAEGCNAAWLILQHAISDPALQRHGLRLLQDACSRGEVPPDQVAMLDDRIRIFEGRPQCYGSQFDWDEHGEMSPLSMDDREHVDQRRRAAGMAPLTEHTRLMREQAAASGERPPTDYVERRREMDAWARSVGW
jgi:hypothetical protein